MIAVKVYVFRDGVNTAPSDGCCIQSVMSGYIYSAISITKV